MKWSGKTTLLRVRLQKGKKKKSVVSAKTTNFGRLKTATEHPKSIDRSHIATHAPYPAIQKGT